MPDMQFSGRSVPRQNNVLHISYLYLISFDYAAYSAAKITHTAYMKSNYLLIVAILFISSMFLVLSSTHVFDERAYASVFKERKTERILPKRALPSLHIPQEYKRFFSQFAP